MPTLTPQHRSGEATEHAMRDGIVSGAFALLPSSFAVWAAMKNSKKFVKSTNYQSRTALVIMPALFVFAFSAESKLNHKMKEIANEAEHARGVTEWAERHVSDRHRQRVELHQSQENSLHTYGGAASSSDLASSGIQGSKEREKQLTDLYRQSVENSGVRVVAGDRLGFYHQAANFWQENPFKILVGLGVPTVLYIFKGRNSKEHLQLQMKLMHTRVYGQFAVITMLLTLMGFKSYMDQNGKFITEYEAEKRVQEMHSMRAELLERLERDRELEKQREEKLRKAHEADLQREEAQRLVDDGSAEVQNMIQKKRKKKKATKESISNIDEIFIKE